MNSMLCFKSAMLLAFALMALAVALPSNEDSWEEQTSVAGGTDWIQAMISSMGGPGVVDKSANPPQKKTVKKMEAKIAKAANAQPVLLDGGSAGTKIFTWDAENPQGKPMDFAFVASFCTKNTETHTSKGVAALAYKQSECEQEVRSGEVTTMDDGKMKTKLEHLSTKDSAKLLTPVRSTATANPPKDGPWVDLPYVPARQAKQCPLPPTDDNMREMYRKKVLQSIKIISNAANGVDASNKQNIPLLATAGTRTKSQSKNDAIWDSVCGDGKLKVGPIGGYKLAPKGKFCKTLAGTEEARYEFIAMVNGQPKQTQPMGTFTMGGASAQIAIPLKKSEEEQFTGLIAAVKSKTNCQNILLSEIPHQVAPIFHPSSKAGTADGCLPDYIDMQPTSAMPQAIQKKLAKGTTAVGLVSFLDLLGTRGTVLMAGGKNEVSNWANYACKDATFVECAGLLDKELQKDPLWSTVTEWFGEHFADIKDFSYTTQKIKDYKPALHTGSSLHDWVEQGCRGKAGQAKAVVMKNGKPGPEKYMDKKCMEALWFSLYITSFFNKSNKAKHTEDQAKMQGQYDWSGGAKAEGLSLLQEPLTHGRHHYMQGVRAELTTESPEMNEEEIEFDEEDTQEEEENAEEDEDDTEEDAEEEE